MPPSGAFPMDDETNNPMYMSLKGRVRRPSAKLIDKEPPVVHQIVSLQIGVAEVLIDEDGQVADGRSLPETVESVFSAEWKQHGRATQKKSGRPRKKIVEHVVEDVIVEPKIPEEEQQLPKEEEEVSDSESMKIASPNESNQGKRKRGRPFKGQEKPVEERLMIETSKIRRLIDDILRKSGDHTTQTTEFCVKLRNVARDIDEAMVHFPSPNFGPEAVPNEKMNELASEVTKVVDTEIPQVTDRTVSDPTEQPMSDAREQPVSDSIEEQMFHPSEQPMSDPTEQPVSDPTEQPVSDSIEEEMCHPTEQPMSDPTEQPMSDPTEQPVSDPTEQPMSDPTEQQSLSSSSTKEQTVQSE